MFSEIMSLHNNCESESFMSYNKIATRVTLVSSENIFIYLIWTTEVFHKFNSYLIYKLMNYTDLLNCNVWNATKQFLCHSLSFWFHNICIISRCSDNVNYEIWIVFNFILIQIQKLWHKDMIISLCIFCCFKIKYLHILIFSCFRLRFWPYLFLILSLRARSVGDNTNARATRHHSLYYDINFHMVVEQKKFTTNFVSVLSHFGNILFFYNIFICIKCTCNN